MQHFALPALAPEHEQETHVPFGFDLPDGDYVVLVAIAANLDAAEPDRLDGRVTCTIRGGTLHPAGSVGHDDPQVGVDIHDLTLEGEHAAVTYSLSGTVWPTSMDCWFQLHHQDAVVWEGGEAPAPQASGIVHSPVPVSLVQPGDGWRLTARVPRAPQPERADGGWQAHLPIAPTSTAAVARPLHDGRPHPTSERLRSSGGQSSCCSRSSRSRRCACRASTRASSWRVNARARLGQQHERQRDRQHQRDQRGEEPVRPTSTSRPHSAKNSPNRRSVYSHSEPIHLPKLGCAWPRCGSAIVTPRPFCGSARRCASGTGASYSRITS